MRFSWLRKSIIVFLILCLLVTSTVPRYVVYAAAPVAVMLRSEKVRGTDLPISRGDPVNRVYSREISAQERLIHITGTGVEPQWLTVTAGSPVTWFNTTSLTHTLVSGEPYRLYLPLVLRDAGNRNGLPGSRWAIPSTIGPKGDGFRATLGPGAMYIYTFTITGMYPYYLATAPQITGNVKVLPFTAALTLTAHPVTLEIGETSILTATVTDQLGYAAPDGTLVTWMTNFETALVPHPTANGVATSTLTSRVAGTVYVTATSGTAWDTAVITFTDGVPVDPVMIAPPVDETVATTMLSATAFLYTGDHPIQTGVVPGIFEGKRVAVLRGKVNAREGGPVSGVTITILDHPEFGQTLTRQDGAFDIAVNGGGELVVQYQKEGYLPVQRDIQVPWQDYIWLPDIVMIAKDTQVTSVALGVGEMQVARGSLINDDDGMRQATVLIPEGTQAKIVLSGGTTQTVSMLNVRATEFTVGDSGPAAMPAELPLASGYTYAVDLRADEAPGQDQEVAFDRPVPVYLENFLEIPTGTGVPVGYYDDESAVWVPSDDGRVIEILAISDGLAELDTTGDGLMDNGVALGITDAERARLATLYTSGQSIWRFTVDHFSSWDANLRYGPPLWARAREMFGAALGKMQKVWCAVAGCDRPGSLIGVQNQILTEFVDVKGTPYTLYYDSSRVPGRRVEYSVHIPLSDKDLPPDLKRIDLEIRVAGRLFTESFTPQPDLDYVFTWDGLDAYEQKVQGMQRAEIAIGYVYDGIYQSLEGLMRSFGYSGNGTPVTASREEVTLWEMYDVAVGGWNARGLGLGGWSLSVHHAYDPTRRILYRGDGERQSADSFAEVIDSVAGYGPYNPYENDLPATEVHVDQPIAVAVTEDGTFYLSEYGQCQIRYVDREHIIRHVAGKWSQLFPCRFEGDGGPATGAGLDRPSDLALGPDGSLYIADAYNHRIRRIDASGMVTTVVGSGAAGQGNGGFGGDDGPATAARLNEPHSVAVSLDGSLYVADTLNHRVRQVRPD
ncbi:MAG: hypothetical protein JXA33_14885, partial [Anaerolineae bacterium]|nr:hypothetical protein [Anaerolineae bacterium]